MIVTRGYLQPLQQSYNHQWSQVWLTRIFYRGLPSQFRSLIKISRFRMELKGKSVVCSLAPLTPQKLACKRSIAHEPMGGKVSLTKSDGSSAAIARKAGAMQSRVGATAGTDQERENYGKGYEELGRYGVDETDYDFVKLHSSSSLHSPSSPRQLTQLSIETRKCASGVNRNSSAKRKASSVVATNDTEEDTEAEGTDWCAYLLLSSDTRKTYVGVTSNVARRLRQHNGELAGGAKAARAGRPWSLVCTVWGFGTRSEACQFEWRWKSFSKSAIGKEKAVAGDDMPTPTKISESQVILRRYAALKEAQQARGEWGEWTHLRVQWHSQD